MTTLGYMIIFLMLPIIVLGIEDMPCAQLSRAVGLFSILLSLMDGAMSGMIDELLMLVNGLIGSLVE